MTQYIDKADIEEILRNLWKQDDGHNSEHRICYNKALQEVQCRLDSLEVKEVNFIEKFNNFVDFIEEFNNFVDRNKFMAKDIISITDMEKTASYFYELGLKAQKGE